MTSLDQRGEAGWEEAWSYLVDAYRQIMERYVRRLLARAGRRGSVDQEAEEVVQSFLAKCVAKATFAQACPERGRFRAFLQTLLRNHLVDCLRRKEAKKRSPGTRIKSLLQEDAAAQQSELREFDEGWVRVALDRALGRLGEENARYATIVRDLIATEGTGSDDIAEVLGAAPKHVPVLKHRARKRFSRLFEAELRSTVSDAQAFAEEWRALSPLLP